jgi:hypothetical protein
VAQTLAWALAAKGDFGIAARRIADDIDVGLQAGFKGHRIDRAPLGLVRDTRDLGDKSGALRRNDIGDIGLKGCEISDEGAGRRINRGHLAAIRQRHPFETSWIERLPGSLEQALLGETALHVEHDQLRTRLLGL